MRKRGKMMEPVAPEDVGFSSARLKRIGDAMRRFVDEGTIAGAVTLVARQGKVAHFEATGLMDREARRPMERDTIFRLASMTKPITVVAALLLFEEGRFLLDDPISDYLPEFARTKAFVEDSHHGVEVADLERPITIRHLLTHTSGLTSDGYANDPVSQIYARERILRPDEALAEKVRRLASLPLAHQPGTRWTYGLSHDVLGRLIEVSSGQPLDVFLEQRIFGPLEMTDTGFSVPPPKIGRLATIYASDGRGGLRRDESRSLEGSKPRTYLSGGGGLVSTAADYGKLCQMLLNGGALGNQRLLGRKTVDLMLSGQWPGSKGALPQAYLPTSASYAMGGSIYTDVAELGEPGSNGSYSWGGSLSTYFWVDPREQLFGVLLAQVVPLNFRLEPIFHVLVYQALTD
jgi:CubicO group peptidase (beta-lactamase class C family)